VDEVVIKLYEKDHVLGVSDIQSHMCIGMRYKCLPEHVEGNDATGGVVEGIRYLAWIRTPGEETKLGETSLYVLNDMFFNFL
jgi:hypothetical protein